MFYSIFKLPWYFFLGYNRSVEHFDLVQTEIKPMQLQCYKSIACDLAKKPILARWIFFSDFSTCNICVQNRRFSTLPDDVTYLIIDKLTTFQTKKPTNQHPKGLAYARIQQTIALQYTINSLGGSFHRLKHSVGWRTDSTDSMFVEAPK